MVRVLTGLVIGSVFFAGFNEMIGIIQDFLSNIFRRPSSGGGGRGTEGIELVQLSSIVDRAIRSKKVTIDESLNVYHNFDPKAPIETLRYLKAKVVFVSTEEIKYVY